MSRSSYFAAWLTILLIGPLPQAALATPDSPLARENLVTLGVRAATLRDLQARGRLEAPIAEQELARTLTEAQELSGEPIDFGDLDSAVSAALQPGKMAQLQRALTFLNLVTFLAAFLFVAAFTRLVFHHLWPLLIRLPRWVHELGIHSLAAAVTLNGVRVGPLHGEWVGLVGCLLWGAATVFSFLTRAKAQPTRATMTKVSALLWGIWSGAALLYSSAMLAHLAVAAGLSAFGFTILVLPGALMLGYTEKDSIPRTMLAAFLALLAGILASIYGVGGPLEIFAPAAVRLAGFVYLVSLLIVAARHYRHPSTGWYIAAQVLAVASCLGFAWCGAIFGLDVLRRYAGSTLAIYVLEKYCEFPWNKQFGVWILLGFSGLLYAGALVARSYPEFFLL